MEKSARKRDCGSASWSAYKYDRAGFGEGRWLRSPGIRLEGIEVEDEIEIESKGFVIHVGGSVEGLLSDSKGQEAGVGRERG